VYKIYAHLQLQDPLQFKQNGIFGLKINHLATLGYNAVPTHVSKSEIIESMKIGRVQFLIEARNAN
jgi:hypothetical protein